MLSLVLAASVQAAAANPPTWSGEVAPVVFSRCVECHRPGGGGPFPLTTYDEVRRKAKTIAAAVADRQMPPWPATEGSELFSQSRRLEAGEIALIERWVDADCPPGDPSKTPPVPAFASSWPLGEPDLVATMPQSFPVPASGRDIYRHFALPIPLGEERWLAAIDIRSNAPSVVHHVLYFLDRSGETHTREGEAGRPGFAGRGSKADESLGGWAVGQRAQRYPLGLGRALGKGGDLVLQVHFHPDGKARDATLEVALYFCRERPTQELLEFQLPPAFGQTFGIDIPPEEPAYEVEDSWTTPADIDLVTVWAHAHMVCVRAEARATLPDGRRIDLLTIPAWDFNWQMRYDFARPVRLPKGTVVEGRLVYDNTASNPNNPHSPPERVTWGEQTTDEMGSLIFNCVAANEADKPALAKSYLAHAADVAKARRSRPDRIRAIARRLDKDGNGVIESAEVPPQMRKDVLAYDIDGDGRVTLEEVERVLAKERRPDSESPPRDR